MKYYSVFMLVCMIRLMVHCDEFAEDALIIRTEGGLIQGYRLNFTFVDHKLERSESSCRVFLGIPYAAPPINGLRWKAPQPHPGWEGVLNASSFGPACPQVNRGGSLLNTDYQSEDCLTLDIWTPDLDSEKNGGGLAVFVFLPGGGFVAGSTNVPPIYKGHALAHHNVIFVAVNYRLGPLGFLYHKQLEKEGPSGNYGLLDQRAALHWVRRNIAKFGGSPDRITLGGESAGAMSACIHTVMPESAGLFNRIILQSGSCVVAFFPKDTALDQAKNFTEALKCNGSKDELECMRGKPIEEVLEALPLKDLLFFDEGYGWAPVVDGTILSDQPYSLFSKNKLNRIDQALVGCNLDEGTLWSVGRFPVILSEEHFHNLLNSSFPNQSENMMKVYGSDAKSYRQVFGEVVGDWVFHCPARFTVRTLTRMNIPTYSYYFKYFSSDLHLMKLLGVCHGCELLFVFNSRLLTTDEELIVSAKMIIHWTQFIKSGDPNREDVESHRWEPYQLQNETSLFFDHPIHYGPYRNDHCDVLEPLFEPFGASLLGFSLAREPLLTKILNKYIFKILKAAAVLLLIPICYFLHVCVWKRCRTSKQKQH